MYAEFLAAVSRRGHGRISAHPERRQGRLQRQHFCRWRQAEHGEAGRRWGGLDREEGRAEAEGREFDWRQRHGSAEGRARCASGEGRQAEPLTMFRIAGALALFAASAARAQDYSTATPIPGSWSYGPAIDGSEAVFTTSAGRSQLGVH